MSRSCFSRLAIGDILIRLSYGSKSCIEFKVIGYQDGRPRCQVMTDNSEFNIGFISNHQWTNNIIRIIKKPKITSSETNE